MIRLHSLHIGMAPDGVRRMKREEYRIDQGKGFNLHFRVSAGILEVPDYFPAVGRGPEPDEISCR
ncbi:hypothetical protein D3C87_1721390 [compost metagenome]